MGKRYEIFKVLKVQNRIVSVETIHGNTVIVKTNLDPMATVFCVRL